MILVIDFGTTTIKAALFDGEHLVRSKSVPIRMQTSAGPGMHEVDPLEWIRATAELSLDLLQGAPRIAGVVISGNGPTVAVSDSNGNPLRPAITWLDRRGIKEAELIQARCGVFVDPSFYLPKTLWLKHNEPRIYDKAAYFFSCPGYIAYRLTGEAAMVFPGEGLENLVYTDGMVKALELDERKFPPFVDFGHQVGVVTDAAAREVHLERGTPVFIGGPDFMMSILGTGAVKPGLACDRAGTSEGINVCVERRIHDDRLLCYRHIAQGFWNVAGIISTSGKALEWYRSLLGGAASYDQLYAMAADVPPGAKKLVFLPYLSGERTPIWDPLARGVFLGLGLNHDTGDLARAVLESTGFAIRDVLSAMTENGVEVDELRVTGSPARSDVWNQIKADITGKRLLVPENVESELVGDLCIAMHRLGRYASPAEAASDLVKIERAIEPAQENKKLYDEMFDLYRETYVRLKPLFQSIAGIDN